MTHELTVHQINQRNYARNQAKHANRMHRNERQADAAMFISAVLCLFGDDKAFVDAFTRNLAGTTIHSYGKRTGKWLGVRRQVTS